MIKGRLTKTENAMREVGIPKQQILASREKLGIAFDILGIGSGIGNLDAKVPKTKLERIAYGLDAVDYLILKRLTTIYATVPHKNTDDLKNGRLNHLKDLGLVVRKAIYEFGITSSGKKALTLVENNPKQMMEITGQILHLCIEGIENAQKNGSMKQAVRDAFSIKDPKDLLKLAPEATTALLKPQKRGSG